MTHSLSNNGQTSGAKSSAGLSVQSVVEEGLLVADDINDYDGFGINVSLSGQHAVVGTSEGFLNGVNSGAAYGYRLINGEWTQTAKLIPDDYAEGDQFGFSVSISGNRALIGSRYDDDNGDFSGSAYVFELIEGNWTQTAKLTADDGSAFVQFGSAVYLDGDRALIGAPLESEIMNNAGAVYVFDLVNNQWNQTAKLRAADPSSSAYFGADLSLENQRALISAPTANGGQNSFGAAYVFDLDAGFWTQTTKLVVNDTITTEVIGYTVSLSGERAVLGSNTQAVYVFEHINDQWAQTSKIINGTGTASQYFGNAVSISGNRIMIGDRNGLGSGNSSGEVSVFDLQEGVWSLTGKIYSANSTSSDDFGWSLSQSAGRVLVGAPQGFNGTDFSGAAYVFVEDVIYSSQFE